MLQPKEQANDAQPSAEQEKDKPEDVSVCVASDMLFLIQIVSPIRQWVDEDRYPVVKLTIEQQQELRTARAEQDRGTFPVSKSVWDLALNMFIFCSQGPRGCGSH